MKLPIAASVYHVKNTVNSSHSFLQEILSYSYILEARSMAIIPEKSGCYLLVEVNHILAIIRSFLTYNVSSWPESLSLVMYQTYISRRPG